MRYYPAPAKINLMLRVIRQEANGYHYLQTIFQFTNLYDEVGFQLTNNQKISFAYPHHHFSLEDDLIYKAAKLLQTYTDTHHGIHIDLKKNLPMGAGLGGGSSNAATTLLALNQLWNLELSQTELLSLGKKLGADVPIFIRGKSAWAEGIGEVFYDITLPERKYLLIIPPLHINTSTIFESPYLCRDNEPLLNREFFPLLQINDCEPAIFHHFPMMKEYIDALKDLKCQPYITGTGACIYIPQPKQDLYYKIMKLADTYKWKLHTFTSSNTSLLTDHIH